VFLGWKIVFRRVVEGGSSMGMLWPSALLRLVLEYMHGRPGAGGGLPPL
jgi:hypothetical protein